MTSENVADTAVRLGGEGGDDLVRRLIEQAGGSRSRLEAARDALVERLRRRSDDFEASVALELVDAALGLVPPIEDFEVVVGYCPPLEENCDPQRSVIRPHDRHV
jgi:hypothetical protein